MSRRYRDKYIDLKINGRLFPSWVLSNFRQFKLPDMIKTDGDPCNASDSKAKLELRKYQLFFTKFLDFNSPYKNILIYHGVGSGKTASTINIYNMLYNYTPGWNVFILLKATLKNKPWMEDLMVWLKEDEKKFRLENIIFIAYDAPNADKLFMDAIKNADSSKKSLYIIEEAHNFIRNVYSNISTKQGRRAQTVYDYIIQDQRENEGTRVICLSGTPAINVPYELALLFNLLRPNIFSKSETQFNQEFVSSSAYRTINPSRKNLFQRRIMGLVSYYIGATPDLYATKRIDYIDCEMSEYQNEIYTHFEAIEEQQARKKRKSKSASSETYKSYTRQACNFVFPFMAQGKSGETRPRPNAFKITEKEAQQIEKAKTPGKEEKYYDVKNYTDAIDAFVNLFIKHLSQKQDEDTTSGRTMDDDIKEFHEEYKGDYAAFLKGEGKDKDEKDKDKKGNQKSSLFTEMHKCSAKFMNIIFNILKSPGPVLFYSNYVLMEGIQIFKVYLSFFGFTSFADGGGKDGFRYTEYHGLIDPKQRSLNMEHYNSIDNTHGKVCKIMMISPAGSEGISLMNVRQCHLTEPYWHEVRMTQMIGRAVRMCSHRRLPMEERHVDIYRYKSVRANDGKWTTDQYIEDLARSKEGLLQSFLDAMKEVAVDCVLYKPHNSLVQDYKCFQFDEPSLLADQVGPAYKEDIYDDMKIDNGMNSMKSKMVRIKVLKIKAVKQLTRHFSRDSVGDGEERGKGRNRNEKGRERESESESNESANNDNVKYSKVDTYWYNPETYVVYDYELHFAVGKVGTDNDNLPKKLNKDTYIIDRVIPIPMIEEGHRRD